MLFHHERFPNCQSPQWTLGVFITVAKSSATSSLTALLTQEARFQRTPDQILKFRFYDVTAILQALFGDRYTGELFHSSPLQGMPPGGEI
jgi:hypothetical protein